MKNLITVNAVKQQQAALQNKLESLNQQRTSLGTRLAEDPDNQALIAQLHNIESQRLSTEAQLSGMDVMLQKAAESEAEVFRLVNTSKAIMEQTRKKIEQRKRITMELEANVETMANTLRKLEEISREIFSDVANTHKALGMELNHGLQYDLLSYHTGISATFEVLLWKAGLGQRGVYLPHITPRNVVGTPFKDSVDRVARGALEAVERIEKELENVR